MKKELKSWKFFLLKRVPVYFIYVLLLVFIVSFFALYYSGLKDNNLPESNNKPTLTSEPQVVRQIRETNYKLIEPLLFTEISTETEKFNPIKENVISFINKKKQEGIITSASVYVRKLKDGNWMAINKDELFSPGSLMKIPTLITILKDAERNPESLEKLIYFKKHFTGIPEQTITGAQLKEGSYYKVKELLYYMIVYSDNDATALLNNFLNFNTMEKLFSDLQLPVPNNKQQDYLIDVADCSKFLRILFNATYLNKEMSEFALDLLTKSAYKDGIIKDMKPDVVVAHKFGERNINGVQQLHEFGIVYYDHDPYLLGIMTKGSNHKLLPEIISGVSDLVFQSMQN